MKKKKLQKKKVSIKSSSTKVKDTNKIETHCYFDIDKTILDHFSVKTIIRYLFKKKKINALFTLKVLYWLILEKLHKLDTERVFREGLLAFKGHDILELNDLFYECFDTELKHRIYNEAKKLIEKKRKGAKIILVTAIYEPIALLFKEHLKADHVISTRLEIKDGKVTGKLGSKICYGENKCIMIQELIKEKKIITDMRHNEAYSDSISDLPMLMMVGKPFATNPDNRLRKHALENKINIIEFIE